MEALFLHLDEELINNRPGRLFSQYTSEELVFWLNFYSIFYDTLYIPANFITDSNLMPEVLNKLNITEPNSIIRSELGNFKIIWDTSRFPENSFSELVNFLHADQNYNSNSKIEIAKHTATLCDKYLKNQIINCDMTAHLDPLESVEQLKHQVFNSKYNFALDKNIIDRLYMCLDEIVSLGEVTGYSRNFYYSVFGYGKTNVNKKIAKKFSEIINKYEPLKHEFLTGVDYVSNRLKARFAGLALGKKIEVLIPHDFLKIICRPDKAATLESKDIKSKEIELYLKQKHRHLLDRESILNMSSDDLSKMHRSDEYNDYKVAWNDIRNYPHKITDQKRIDTIEKALNKYIDRVCLILNPMKYISDKSINILGTVISTTAGFSVNIGLGLYEKLQGVSDSSKQYLSEYFELFSRYAIDSVLSHTTRRKALKFHTFELSDDISVY